ncbi:MAG TPA: hypothetical protein VFV68_09715 [Agriterribacter sp.]|nr:hypothetical protein [Agriterribacter sp.]
MKSTLWTILCLVALFTGSCQKEASFKQDNDPPAIDPPAVSDTILSAENGGLLRRMVLQYEGEQDSMVFAFKYDGNGKLVELYGVNEGPADADDNLFSLLQQFDRNANGVAQKIKIVSYLYYGANNPQLHWSANYDVHYDETTSRYTYALMTGTGESEPLNDSIAYSYASNGLINVVAEYHLEPNDTAQLDDKFEYTYDANGRISVQKATSVRNYPNREDWFINQFEYDAKVNPMNFGQELLLTGELVISSPTPNNITRCTNAINSEESYTVQYTYNDSNKPKTAEWQYNSGEKATMKYYYQN